MDELYRKAHESSMLYASITGVLQAIAEQALGRLDRCPSHDPVLTAGHRDTLALIERVLTDPNRSPDLFHRELDALRERQRVPS